VNVIVNSAQVQGGTRGLERIEESGALREIEVPLDKYENHIQVRVANASGQEVKNIIVYNPAMKDLSLLDVEKKGRLFVLAIGIDKYVNRPAKDQLRFASADAKSFYDEMMKAGKKLYSEVKPMLITSTSAIKPTRDNIVDAIEGFFLDATANDTSVLFLAGHGVVIGRDYAFMPEDAESQNGRWRPSKAIRWSEIQGALQNAKGKRVMFIDTCHSAGVVNAWMMSSAADTQIVVFSATDLNTLAIEEPGLGHGVFTYALLGGLYGNADYSKDGFINIFELNTYVSQDVTSRTKGKQRPAFQSAGTDFTLVPK
jgi:uncharacterized caspase-like protein